MGGLDGVPPGSVSAGPTDQLLNVLLLDTAGVKVGTVGEPRLLLEQTLRVALFSELFARTHEIRRLCSVLLLK